MREDAKNRFQNLLKNLDNKVLQAKLGKVIDKIQNGEIDELVQKLNEIQPKDLSKNLQNLENMSDADLSNLKAALSSKIQKEELIALQQKLDPDKRKFLEKIISNLDAS